jgi:hypothetical protein
MKKALIGVRVTEAAEQIGMVRDLLDSEGIPEVSLSEDEDSHTNPPSSEPVLSDCADSESESESNHRVSTSVGSIGRHTGEVTGTSSQVGMPSRASVLRKLGAGLGGEIRTARETCVA